LAVSVEIGRLIDEGPWSNFQKRVVGLACLATVLDGMAILSLGLALPALIKDWHLSAGDFSLVTAGGLIGMGIGTTSAGVMGDRLGRKPCLVMSMLVFGCMTAASAWAPGLISLGLLRSIAGLGLGGALPNAASLIAEYTPVRRRLLAVAIASACTQAGGMLAGVLAAGILKNFGWHLYFLVGGLLPILFALILVVAIPESPQFLLQKPGGAEKLRTIARHLGYQLDADTTIVRKIADANSAPKAGLLGRKQRRDTLMLWGAFFGCYLAVFMVPSWLPTMLTMQGFAFGIAGAGMAAYNFGGVLGAIGAGWVLSRFGSRLSMVAMGAGGALWALLLMEVLKVFKGNAPLAIILIFVQGIFVIGIMAALLSFATNIYPTSTRATGVGVALSFARVGAVMSAFAGPAALRWGGAPAYFGFIATAMGMTAIFVSFTRNHNCGEEEQIPISSLCEVGAEKS
jgi:MFS transporter, AAHS family, 4-hydroxybenzoate transporter